MGCLVCVGAYYPDFTVYYGHGKQAWFIHHTLSHYRPLAQARSYQQRNAYFEGASSCLQIWQLSSRMLSINTPAVRAWNVCTSCQKFLVEIFLQSVEKSWNFTKLKTRKKVVLCSMSRISLQSSRCTDLRMHPLHASAFPPPGWKPVWNLVDYHSLHVNVRQSHQPDTCC